MLRMDGMAEKETQLKMHRWIKRENEVELNQYIRCRWNRHVLRDWELPGRWAQCKWLTGRLVMGDVGLGHVRWTLLVRRCRGDIRGFSGLSFYYYWIYAITGIIDAFMIWWRKGGIWSCCGTNIHHKFNIKLHHNCAKFENYFTRQIQNSKIYYCNGIWELQIKKGQNVWNKYCTLRSVFEIIQLSFLKYKVGFYGKMCMCY